MMRQFQKRQEVNQLSSSCKSRPHARHTEIKAQVKLPGSVNCASNIQHVKGKGSKLQVVNTDRAHQVLMGPPSPHNNNEPVVFHNTRPPDTTKGDHSYTPPFTDDKEDFGLMDLDEFLDARDQGYATSGDAEMEVVVETTFMSVSCWFAFLKSFCLMNLNKIFIWNCRGAASPDLFRNCKQCIDVHRPEIFMIMETRINPIRLKNTFNLLGFDGFTYPENRVLRVELLPDGKLIWWRW